MFTDRSTQQLSQVQAAYAPKITHKKSINVRRKSRLSTMTFLTENLAGKRAAEACKRIFSEEHREPDLELMACFASSGNGKLFIYLWGASGQFRYRESSSWSMRDRGNIQCSIKAQVQNITSYSRLSQRHFPDATIV